jgi:tRNA pseudouridine38-40 synthase
MHHYRYFIHLAYDGTNYHGWQLQKTALSVQEVITQALEVRLKVKPISIVGCGRTDTGVHASEFYAHFDLDDAIPPEGLEELTFRLNKQLPKDIVIFRIFMVDPDLHARFHAISRTYTYHLHTKKDPFLNLYSYYLYGDLDLDLMNEAAGMLKRYDDFTSFARLNAQTATNICKIINASWERVDHRIVFTITADRFLRNMVRAIVGTVLNLGQKKIDLDDFKKIIEARDREKAGKSAAARGLFLVGVKYPEERLSFKPEF